MSMNPGSDATHEERIFNPDYIKLWFGLLFFMLNMSSFNLLPYHLELRGASPDLYGVVVGSMGLSSFFCLVLLGHKADSWSRKKTFSIYFTFAFAGNLASLWAMGQPDLNWYYAGRLLQGVFMGVGFPIVFSWTMEVSPPSMKHVVLAWFGIAGILANSLGPTLGELVLSFQPDPNHPDAYIPVFIMATAFELVSLVFFLSTRDVKPEPSKPGASRGLLPLLGRPESVLTLLVALSFGGIFGVLMSFSKNYVSSLGLEFVSVLLWSYTIGAIFSRVFIQFVARIFPRNQIAPLGLAGLGVSFLLLGLAGGYPMLGAMGFLYGLSHGILYPTLYVQFVNYQKAGEMGRAATLFQGSFSVGWGLLPMMGGTVIRIAGFPTLFSLLGALSGLGIILILNAESFGRARQDNA